MQTQNISEIITFLLLGRFNPLVAAVGFQVPQNTFHCLLLFEINDINDLLALLEELDCWVRPDHQLWNFIFSCVHLPELNVLIDFRKQLCSLLEYRKEFFTTYISINAFVTNDCTKERRRPSEHRNLCLLLPIKMIAPR